MAINHKLTHVIGGRAIAQVEPQPAKLLVTFADGSKMTIKIADGAQPPAAPTTPIDAVHQDIAPPALHLLSAGTTWTVPLAEATSCVMVRDAHGVMEYAD